MRKPAEVLELALTLLDENKDSCYMCVHLDWMGLEGYILQDEKFDTRSCVLSAIGGYSTLGGYLRSIDIVPWDLMSDSPEYRPYMVEFYTNLIAKLKQE